MSRSAAPWQAPRRRRAARAGRCRQADVPRSAATPTRQRCSRLSWSRSRRAISLSSSATRRWCVSASSEARLNCAAKRSVSDLPASSSSLTRRRYSRACASASRLSCRSRSSAACRPASPACGSGVAPFCATRLGRRARTGLLPARRRACGGVVGGWRRAGPTGFICHVVLLTVVVVVLKVKSLRADQVAGRSRLRRAAPARLAPG